MSKDIDELGGISYTCGHPEIRLRNGGFDLPCHQAKKHEHFICHRHKEIACNVCVDKRPTKSQSEGEGDD